MQNKSSMCVVYGRGVAPIISGSFSIKARRPDITARMVREVAKALLLPATKTRYESLGAEPVGLGNAEFKSLLTTEASMLSALIKDSKINVD